MPAFALQQVKAVSIPLWITGNPPLASTLTVTVRTYESNEKLILCPILACTILHVYKAKER